VLGAPVRRGIEVRGFRERDDHIEVETSTGSFTAKYLAGCDGGRSAIRKAAGFDFPGTAPTLTGWQMMAKLDHPEKLKLGWNRTAMGMMAVGPMPGRVFIADLSGPPPDRNAPITKGEVEAALRRVSGTDVKILALDSVTRFTDNARQATSYVKGRVVLAGDAAHVHSPFGGQGLNLSLVDAANLGWKLAAAVGGRPELLDSYTTERHPVGARALAATRAQIALMRTDELTSALRAIVADLMKTDDGTRYFGELLSGVDIRYDLGDPHPLVGRLVANTALELPTEERALYTLLESGRPLLFGPTDFAPVARGRADVVRTRGGPSMLIRPDGCIAWASQDGEEGADDRLHAALERWWGPPDRANASLAP
jgi:flavin-dependent dehydrogenase